MRRRWRARRVLSASVVVTWTAVQACGSQLVNPRETKPIRDALGACAYSLARISRGERRFEPRICVPPDLSVLT